MEIDVSLVSLAVSIAIIAVSFGGVLVINVIKNIKAKTELKDWEVFSITLDTAEKVVKTVAEAVVGKLEQVSAKELREKIKEGLANRESLLALADEAYDEIMGIVSTDVFEVLSEGITDIESYVKNEIETQVGLLKSKSDEIK